MNRLKALSASALVALAVGGATASSAMALNPQPLPPLEHPHYLNPQPLPPSPPPEI